MARGLSNALRIALGGVAGGLEGYGAKQERLGKASLLKQQQERQAEQDAISALNMFRAAGGGITLAGTRPVNASVQEAFALPEVKLPAQTIDPSTFRQRFTQATQADLGVAPRPTGLLDTPLRLALETAPRRMTTPATPVTPRRTMKVGGMDFELKAPEEMAQEAKQREIEEYRQKQIVNQEIATNKANAERQAKQKEAEDTATLLEQSYVGPDGKPITRQQALYAAKIGEDPIDLGFVQKAMTQAERERLAIARANLRIAKQRLTMDKEAKQDAVSDVQNFYDEERKTIAQFMPQPYKDKSGAIRYKAPAVDLTKGIIGSQNLAFTRSDWTNWMASEDAQRYASAVKRISDSYAVAKEGRNASNTDKESYLNAVMVRPGEFKNYRLMQEKWQRLQSYINFLESKEKKGVSNRQSAGTAGGSALVDLENMGMD